CGAAATTQVQTANVGKPVAESDGMIRLDFVSLLPASLTLGGIYEAVGSAVGPEGTTPGARSNTFSFGCPCPPTISPANQSLAVAGGSVTVTVNGAAGCAWTAVSNDAWITGTSGGPCAATGTGHLRA